MKLNHPSRRLKHSLMIVVFLIELFQPINCYGDDRINTKRNENTILSAKHVEPATTNSPALEVPEWEVPQNDNHFDEKFASLEQGIGSLELHVGRLLEQRFNDLTQQLNQLTLEVSSGLICTQGLEEEKKSKNKDKISDGDFGKDNGVSVPETPTTVPTIPTTKFRVVRVNRTESDSLYGVHIDYEASQNPTTILLSPKDAELENEVFGKVSAIFPKRDSAATVAFVFPDMTFGMDLNLADPHSVMDVPSITLDVAPKGDGVIVRGNDVIYKPGSKITADAHLKIDAKEELDSEIFGHIYVKSSTKENTVISYPFMWWPFIQEEPPVYLSIVGEIQGSKNDRNMPMMLNFANDELDGEVDLQVDVFFNCSVNCLVKKVGIQYKARFYREGKTGPFPDNFLGFIENWGLNGTTIVEETMCSDPCSFSCLAFGDNVHMTIVPPSYVNSNFTASTVAMNGMSVLMITFLDHSNDIEGNYTCVASNEHTVIEQNHVIYLAGSPLFFSRFYPM